jgi:hypothetical protein
MNESLRDDIMAAARKMAIGAYEDGMKAERQRIIALIKPLAEHNESETCHCDAYEHALYLVEREVGA